MITKSKTVLTPSESLNPAYYKQKLGRSQIDLFKTELISLLNQVEGDGLEEFVKNALSDFLKNTWYKGKHYINIKERKDLVIHHDDNAKSEVGVIIEVKAPKNKSEMVSKKNLNTKALHELLLYYLTERIGDNNKTIKHLIVTNVNEWFVFDEIQFDTLFAQNKKLVDAFKAFQLDKHSTDWFYKEIAQEHIALVEDQLNYTFFDIRKYEKELKDDDKKNDKKLIALYKMLSPEHLLKLPFANDSNQLDRKFYSELLHIIGLGEEKEKGKKLIQRCQPDKRHEASLLEAAIIQIDALDKLSRLSNAKQYGNNREEQLFNVGLELVITWVNRVLFLKLLEGQLLTYNKNNVQYKFLDLKHIKNYDDLNTLFFQVLAKTTTDRRQSILEKFAHIPYLNSSLFEPTELEQNCIMISNLADEREIPIISGTVLKDEKGKAQKGNLVTIEYLFRFLNAYDFTSEGAEDIQEENKTIINASVLGLIFEKINGYKDGSFFTPGFITMYMCRETLRRSVVQKFNDAKAWSCKNLDDIYDKIEDRTEANNIVNSLKVCDPAVGSGHFLVSVLNELIAIKYELGILQDANGKKLRDVEVAVVNDELIVRNDGELFEYNPNSKESQRIQETLFKEKQSIIENCLFGVDINPNSVKICRLRLWIELLKNAYYKAKLVSVKLSSGTISISELETLPNIDINIKCGNSLISRFALDEDLKKALKSIKWNIESYKGFVRDYKHATNKEEKHGLEKLIEQIKGDFKSEINKNDPKERRLQRLNAELWTKYESGDLFESKLSAAEKRDKKKLETEIKKLTLEIEEIKSNKIYENAFEWRFEFPEVLNDKGDFVGFDVIIGNPPYFQIQYSQYGKDDYFKKFNLYEKTGDIYSLFFELSTNLLKQFGTFSIITSNRFGNTNYGVSSRKFLSEYHLNELINFNKIEIFDEANVGTIIVTLTKKEPDLKSKIKAIQINNLTQAHNLNSSLDTSVSNVNRKYFSSDQWIFDKEEVLNLKFKIQNKSIPLCKVTDLKINRGITTGANKIFIIPKELGDSMIALNPKNSEIIKPVLKGAEIKRFEIKEYSNYLLCVKTGVDICKFPEVYKYLKKHKSSLEKVYETKNGSKKWFELRKCSYYSSFKKEKLIWTRLSSINSFAISTDHEFSIDSTSFATGENLKYYCTLLNSKLILFYFKLGSVIWGTNGIKWFGQYFDSIPIAIGDKKTKSDLSDLYFEIQSIKKSNPQNSTIEIERKIDQLVYKLYDLTEEEIKIVEESVK